MLERLRSHLGAAGLVVAIVALVAALGCGAYAASSGSGSGKATASAKQGKRGKPGKPGKTGPAGPAGPAGQQGPAGANGKDGSNGTKGANGSSGTAGQSVTVTEEPAFGECGDQSGYKLDSASGVGYVCNGADGEDGTDGVDGTNGAPGQPWTAGGTLPVGATETGTWSLSATLDASPKFFGFPFQLVPISFSIPLSEPTSNQEHVVFVKDSNTPHCSAAPINGSTADPKAESGYLCVYIENVPLTGTLTPSELLAPASGPAGNAIEREGTVLYFDMTEDTIAFGSWAVTG